METEVRRLVCLLLFQLSLLCTVESLSTDACVESLLNAKDCPREGGARTGLRLVDCLCCESKLPSHGSGQVARSELGRGLGQLAYVAVGQDCPRRSGARVSWTSRRQCLEVCEPAGSGHVGFPRWELPAVG